MLITKKRASYKVSIGNLAIGGGQPVRVQSMTSTATENIAETHSQIKNLVSAGSEIVRISVYNQKAATSVPVLKEKLLAEGIDAPLVGDFHYNGNKLLKNFEICAQTLDKYRINPGNVGTGNNYDKNFAEIIELACKHQKPVRIGVNWGSLDQNLLAGLMDKNSKAKNPLPSSSVLEQALVESALTSAQFAEKIGLSSDKIVISCKTSAVPSLLRVYRLLAKKCRYPLHLGLTEAGMGESGIVHSSIGIGILLAEGIGDTIRVSLTPSPTGKNSRSVEVRIAQEIIQSLEMRRYQPRVISCPGCGRTTSSYFLTLAKTINDWISDELPTLKTHHPGVESLTIAVMGCIVNGPGESKHADIGISLPGTGENPQAPVYIKGNHHTTLKGDTIAQDFIDIIQEHIHSTYPNT